MATFVVGVVYGEWVEKESGWEWYAKSNVTTPLLLSTDTTYEMFIDEIIKRSELSCLPTHVNVKYIITNAPPNEKVHPTEIKSDEDLTIYKSDVGCGGWRPILKVSISHVGEDNQFESPNIDVNFIEYEICSPNENTIFDSDFNGEDETMDVDENNRMEALIEEQNKITVKDNSLTDHLLLEDGDADEETMLSEEMLEGKTGGEDGRLTHHTFDDGSDLYEGYLFNDKLDAIRKIKFVAVKGKFEFVTKKSTKSLIVVACSSRNCKWWIRCVKNPDSSKFVIRKYIREHKCGLERISAEHRQASADVIGEFVKPLFVNGKGPTSSDLKNYVKTQLGCDVSYWKCWKGRQHAKDFVRGTPEHGFAVLEAYRHILEVTNEGTKTDLAVDKENRFLYFFVAFGPCIRGFALMRIAIALDGCFLTGKFGGTLFVATAQDGENHIYPIAWAVVDSENDKSWGWFLKHLQDIVPDSDELCLISDRNQSIKNSIAKVYPMAHHGYCMRHLGENLRTKFKCGKIIHPFYSAAQAYTLDDFHEHFHQIRLKKPEAADYLEHDVGFHRWSRAHSPANRFNIMTTNIAESINARILIEREFPIIALFDAIQRILSTWFYERRMEMVDCTTILVPSKENILRKNLELSDVLVATPINVHEFIVRGGSQKVVVDLNKKECSCRVFNVDKIPCSHAIAAIKQQKLPDFGQRIYTFCSPTFKAENFLHAYAETIYPTPTEEQWEVPESVANIIIYPPKLKPSRGRKRVKRFRSACEGNKRKNMCSKCKQPGHKKRTCKQPPVSK